MRVLKLLGVLAASFFPIVFLAAGITDGHIDVMGGAGILAGPTTEAFEYVEHRETAAAPADAGFAAVIDVQPSGDPLVDLPSTLTMNGTSMTLVTECLATQVSGTTLTCTDSKAMPETGSGTSPTNTAISPFASDPAVMTTTAGTNKYYQATDTSFGDLGTNDFAIEAIAALDNTNGAISYEHFDGTAGMRILGDGTNVNVRLLTGATGTNTLIPNTGSMLWQHMFCTFDRDDGGATSGGLCNSNGIAGTPTAITARSGSLSNTTAARFGRSAANAGSKILLLRIWTCAACLAGGAGGATESTAMSLTRSSQAWGVSLDTGTTKNLLAAQRATAATIDKLEGGVRTIYYGGTAAPVVNVRSTGTGWRIGASSTNIARNSATLQTTWAASAVTVQTNTWQQPDERAAAGDALRNTLAAGDVAHCITRTTTSSLTAATPYTFSVYGKAGDKGHIIMDIGGRTGDSWFNLSTCAAGTLGAGVTASHGESWGNSICRTGVTALGNGTTEVMKLCCASADNVGTYDDGIDVADDCNLWGVQLEARPVPSPYIETGSSADVARNADVFSWSATSNITTHPFTLAVSFFSPSYTLATGTSLLTFYEDATNYTTLRLTATNDTCEGITVSGGATQANQTVTGDVIDGTLHTCRLGVTTNSSRIWKDSTEGTADTSVTAKPTAGVSYLIGQDSGATSQPDVVITRVQGWSVVQGP